MLFSFVLSLRKKNKEKVELPRSIKLTSCLSMKQDQKKIMMRGFLFHVVFFFLNIWSTLPALDTDCKINRNFSMGNDSTPMYKLIACSLCKHFINWQLSKKMTEKKKKMEKKPLAEELTLGCCYLTTRHGYAWEFPSLLSFSCLRRFGLFSPKRSLSKCY